MQLNQYLAESVTESSFGEDPGRKTEQTIVLSDSTDGQEISFVTEVGTTFEAWITLMQCIDQLDSVFDGDLAHATEEELTDQEAWEDFDVEMVEHIREMVISNLSDDTKMHTIDMLSIQELTDIYGKIIEHCTARCAHLNE